MKKNQLCSTVSMQKNIIEMDHLPSTIANLFINNLQLNLQQIFAKSTIYKKKINRPKPILKTTNHIIAFILTAFFIGKIVHR